MRVVHSARRRWLVSRESAATSASSLASRLTSCCESRSSDCKSRPSECSAYGCTATPREQSHYRARSLQTRLVQSGEAMVGRKSQTRLANEWRSSVTLSQEWFFAQASDCARSQHG